MSIDRISIRNFKSLKSLKAKCRKLTVATGLNSSGKSSLIQALFVLRAAYHRRQNPTSDTATLIPLETPETGAIGAFQDLLNYDYEGEGTIAMSVTFSDHQCFSFETVPYQLSNKKDREVQGKVEAQITADALPALFSNNLQYLSALRAGPADLYPAAPRADERQLGKDGRFAAHVLEHHGLSLSVHPAMCLPIEANGNTKDDLLSRQADAWLAHITSNPKINIKVEANSASEVELTYNFANEQGLPNPRDTRPINVGFGVSYVFPVLVALLSAKPGDLLIIENPESDLHARAQSRLGELMARAASAGVQLIIETHSEHIINGIRLQIKAYQESLGGNGLPAEDVAIHYFARNSQGETELVEAALGADAKLSIASGVNGFFDQLDEDLLKIL